MGKREFFDRIRYVFGVEKPGEVSRYCREYWPDETEHMLKTAEDACENRFLFDFPWDMERTWEPVEFPEEIDWSLIPFGDREFLWQFNRHRFLLCLGQAYLMTGNERYGLHHARLLEDWIMRAEEGDNIDLGPWRTLETGLRAETWLRSLCMVEASEAVTDQLTDEVQECLKRHGTRLAEHFSAHKYISNWGVLESSGLLLLSIAMREEDPRWKEWEETALKRLVHGARLQVLEDGTQWEQSPMYHNEVYQCFRSALYYGERAGIVIPEEIRTAVKKMAWVNGIWKKPDHTQFAQGDSDASDLRGQITAGAWQFRDPVLKYWGYEAMDFENAWQFGYEACEEYNRMKTAEPAFTSAELPFSGNYYFRSSWADDGNLMHFHCGDTGGGHGHGDKLHVDLVLGGEDVLVDGGRSTYVDGDLRYELKEPGAHNVMVVDKIPCSKCETSWIYQNLCSCLKQQYFDGKTGAFVEGSHLGYLGAGILVNRQVIWVKPGIFVIVDHSYGTGFHTFESLYHFGRDGSVNREEYGIHFAGKKVEAWLQCVTGDGKEELRASRQSLHYNEIGENQTLSICSSADQDFCRIVVINGGKKGQTRPVIVEKVPVFSVVEEKEVDSKDAEALRFTTGEKEYLLLLCHREIMTPTDILRCENCIGYGKAVLFDRTYEKRDVVTGEVLAWW